MKSLESLPNAYIRIGQAAEDAFNASRPFSLAIPFPTYAAGLSFRRSFYSARKHLRALRSRNSLPLSLLAPYQGMERLSLSRLDKAQATSDLATFGSCYVTASIPTHSALDSILDSLDIPALDTELNATQHRTTAAPSASATPTPSHSSSPTTPLTSDTTLLIYDCAVRLSSLPTPALREYTIALHAAIQAQDGLRITLYTNKLLAQTNIPDNLHDTLLSEKNRHSPQPD